MNLGIKKINLLLIQKMSSFKYYSSIRKFVDSYIRKKRFIPYISLGLIILLTPLAYFISQKPSKVEAAWMDDNWLYRKAIAIPSHSAAENNVYVTVPTFDATDTSKFQADCGDLRFTKQNGELLPYYVVDCDATANIHVLFDTLPAGASTYYMYYGNPSAPNGFSSADFPNAASGLGTQTLAAEEQSPGPVAYWSFDDGQGSVAQDATQNNNDGSLGAGSSAPAWQTEDMCVSSKCLKFDGNDYIGIGSTVRDVKTVSFWVKPITNSQNIIDLDGGSHYISASSGVISATGFATPSFYVNGVSSTTLTANSWQYVTVTTATSFNATNISLGKRTTNFLNGFLDEVKIYPYARSAAQIKSDYASAGSEHGAAAVLGSSKDSSAAFNEGLVGYWKMDEASWNGSANEVIDSSGNGNHGVGVGSTKPTTGAGKFGNGGVFNGANDVSVSNTVSSIRTVTFWVKPNSNSTSLLALNTSNYISASSGTISTTGFTSTIYVNGASSTTLTASVWQHVVVTTTSAVSGSAITFALANSNYLTGTLDEVRIYNRALSPAEVRDLYNWAPGPVGYWNFNEGIGSSAADSSGYGNTGSWSGTGTHWAAGKYGKAGNFSNSGDDFVNIPNSTTIDRLNNFTYEAWIKRGTANGYMGVIASSTANNADMRFASDGTTLYFFVNGTYSSIGSIDENEWHHIAGTWNGTTIQVYLNGVLMDSDASTSPTFSGTSIYIGKRAASGDSFNGFIDDVHIYNYARTQKQIVEDMNAGHPAVGSPVGSALAWYKFDEGYGTTASNAGFAGSTLNGTLGTGNSAPTWSNNGKYGKALSFDGGDKVTSTITDPAYTNTISLWINPSTSIASKTLVTASKLTTDSSSRPVYGGCTGTAISLNQWTHLVAVSDGSSICKIYQNGKQTASSTTGVTFGTSVNIGAGSYVGLLDDFKLYNYPLTEDEINLDYNQGKALVLGALSSGTGNTAPENAASQEYCIPGDTASCTAPVARWDFNEGVGTTAYDSSGNSNHGTLGTGNSAPTWTAGKIGKGLRFDGVDDYVTKASADSLGITGNVSVEAWIKTTSSVASGIVAKYDIHGHFPYQLYMDANGKINFRRGNDSGWDTNLTSLNAINNGLWHQVSVVADSEKMRIYIDGKEDNSVSEVRSASYGGSWKAFCIGIDRYDCSTYLGQGWDHNYFTGLIDQVRIYNYARSPAQIAWDYNRGEPVGWWKFDECQGATAYDSIRVGTTIPDGTITIGGTGTQSVVGTCAVGVGSTAAWGNGSVGKYNSSLNFDGTDDYVQANGLGVGTSAGNYNTISFWMKWNGTTGKSPIGMAGGGYYNFFIWSSSCAGFNTGAGDGYGFNPTGLSNQWAHIVLLFYNGAYTGNNKIYVNGVEKTLSQCQGSGNSGTARTTLYIGQLGNNNYYYGGQIDDVRIYNYALTAEQVKTLYNENSAIRFGPSSGSP